MLNEDFCQECLEKYIGILLRYLDELYDDFVGDIDLSYVLDDLECEEIELSDAEEYGSGEFDYYKKSEVKEEMNDQIETIISDAEDAFNESVEEFSDRFYEAIEGFDDRMDDAFGVIDNFYELCMEDIIEDDNARKDFEVCCEKKMENVYSVIRIKREEIHKVLSTCEEFIDNYFEKHIGSVKEYAKLCDIEEDEDYDEDTVYAYILDDALEQIQEDTNNMLEDIPQMITDEYQKQLVIIFDELRLGVKEELKEYLTSPVVIESYKADDGDTYRIFNDEDVEENDLCLHKQKGTFMEKLEAEVVGTAWFLSGFFQ